MRRITIEEVRAAYDKTGLHIIQGSFVWYDDVGLDSIIPAWDGKQPLRGTACALTAVAIAESITIEMHAEGRAISELGSKIRSYLGLDHDYFYGFLLGFDNDRIQPETESERAGYADGTAVRRALLDTD